LQFGTNSQQKASIKKLRCSDMGRLADEQALFERGGAAAAQKHGGANFCYLSLRRKDLMLTSTLMTC
jgi:hypothetical protein